MKPLSAVLFDLDGTLVDTAPDMANAINQVLIEQEKKPLAFEDIRPFVSKGSPGLIKLTFGLTPADESYEQLKDRFLAIYKDNLSVHSNLFTGLPELLFWLERNNIHWGIVTNKPGYLTQLLVEDLNLIGRAAVIVSGDSFSEKKPHPMPLIESCKLIKVKPEHCIYVGDDKRDIIAGNAAKMTTIAALWGYIPNEENPSDWGSDMMANNVAELVMQVKRLSIS